MSEVDISPDKMLLENDVAEVEISNEPEYDKIEIALQAVAYNPDFEVPYPTDREHAFEILKITPQLPYRHWMWPLSKSVLFHEGANELARITGSVGLSIYYAKESDVLKAMELCRDNNAQLCLQYSPWHYAYKNPDPRGWGPDAYGEMMLMYEKFKQVSEWIDDVNDNIEFQDKEVAVGLCEFDQEILRHEDEEDRKVAIKEKNDISYRIFKHYFPGVDILYHGFGYGSIHHVYDQLNDGYTTTEMYEGNQRSLQKYKYADFVDKAELWKLDKIVPAISMAGYYDMGVETQPKPAYQKGEHTAYPVRYTWERARNMWHWYFRREQFADKYGPTGRFTEGYLWPYPFNPSHIGYEWHFIAYCFGAWNHKKFENQWVDKVVA